MEERFFIDKRAGCIAVRDRQHPQYDSTYQGLHFDTPDVICYFHGKQGKDSWYVGNMEESKCKKVLKHLNKEIKWK